MSAHVVVIGTDLRRATVKVNPGTYLTDVLEQACAKLGLKSDGYLLKYKQRQVDLSVPYRTAGLIPGAKLELVQKSKTPSAVQVALQVPLPEGKDIPGGRLIRKFPSDLTLWKVLRQFESGDASHGRNINITARGVARTAAPGAAGAGQLYYETPILNIMGRELPTFEHFQKTLSQLGYNSGSVLLRLTFKTTDQTLFEAMEQIGQFFKDDAAEERATTEDTHGNSQAEGIAVTAPAVKEPSPEAVPAAPQPEAVFELMDIDDPPTNMPAEASADPYQPVNVYLAPSGTTPVAAQLPPPKVDPVPTVAHAQLHQARLQQSSRNKRLPSDREIAEKAAAEEARLAAIRSVRVKVRFPDNTSSDWDVGHSETGAFLYEAVRHVMATPDAPFRLVMPGGKTTIKDDSSPRHNLIRAYGLSGRILINLVWDDAVSTEIRRRTFLKASVAQQGQAVRVPEMLNVEEKDEEPSASTPSPANPEKRDGDGGKPKIPKWLKLGKK